MVRMYNPPKPRLATRETCRMLALCQARIVPLGEERRGCRRKSFVVATETPETNDTLFQCAIEDIPLTTTEIGAGSNGQLPISRVTGNLKIHMYDYRVYQDLGLARPRSMSSLLAGAFGERKSGIVFCVRRGRLRNSTGHSVMRSCLT